uniref:Uncharacterized protein n=1 Tax=Scleropages formosus TaxID=113540 RepID=A0A8C9VQK9_SCLFO
PGRCAISPPGPQGSKSYPPLSVGVRPKSVHRPTDMRSELSTVTTAARARPHLDFTMSIFPVGRERSSRSHARVRTHTHTHTTGTDSFFPGASAGCPGTWGRKTEHSSSSGSHPKSLRSSLSN